MFFVPFLLCFVPGLFYYKLERPLSLFFHFTTPALVGCGCLGIMVVGNIEAISWGAIIIAYCTVTGIPGSLCGALASRLVRQAGYPESQARTLTENVEPAPAHEGLHGAVQQGNVEQVLRYLDEGADINKEVGHDSPLDVAIETGDLKMVRLLAARGAEIKHSLTGKSQIRRAHHLSHSEIARFLQEEFEKRSSVLRDT